MTITIRILQRGDEAILGNVAPDVFDDPINEAWTAEFLSDPRHHLAVALDDGLVVGMASAVHYLHPDKPTELWINEVGVAPTHWRRGLGKALINALLQLGRELGAKEAWVLTERDNTAAINLYQSTGGVNESDDTVMFTFYLNE
jgi:ribosomal protein S18 acetylase RimI-like enzyme